MIPKFLRAWWVGRRYAHLEHRALILNYKSSDLRRALEKLDVLEPSDFSVVNNLKVSDLEFNGVHDSIGEFTQALRAVLTYLSIDEALDNRVGWIYEANRPMPLAKWLTRNGEFYTDPTKALSELIPLLKDLLTRRLDPTPAKPNSFRNYNERLLHHTYQTVHSLIDSLALMHMRCLST